MMSLNKLLLLAALIAAVWFGFRWWQRHQLAARQAPPRAKDQRRPDQRGPDLGTRGGDVEDMRACPVCGTYVAAGSGPCERTDCARRAA